MSATTGSCSASWMRRRVSDWSSGSLNSSFHVFSWVSRSSGERSEGRRDGVPATIHVLSFVTAFRALSRAGAVLCLLLAAVSLGAGVTEYPGYTRAALRYMAEEVLPLVVVGLVNVAALDAVLGRARWVGLLAIAVDVALLIHALPAVRTGPFAFMLAGAAASLVIGTVGVALSRSHARRPDGAGDTI